MPEGGALVKRIVNDLTLSKRGAADGRHFVEHSRGACLNDEFPAVVTAAFANAARQVVRF